MDMNLKVNIGVELNRAKVELTSDQKNSVEKFIGNLLVGDRRSTRAFDSQENSPKRLHKDKKTFPLGHRGWTKEDEAQFLQVYRELRPTIQSTTRLLQAVGQRIGRTSHACNMRLWVIRRGEGYTPASQAPEKTNKRFGGNRFTVRTVPQAHQPVNGPTDQRPNEGYSK